jgi:hypothetical protein
MIILEIFSNKISSKETDFSFYIKMNSKLKPRFSEV